MRIGVVCEGSNDYIALRAIFFKVAAQRGKIIEAFDAIQPRVDATSSVQLNGGGWHRVKVWLEDNGGAELKKILSSRLFSVSKPYDYLLIHMDGDVVWLSPDFDGVTRASCFNNPQQTVQRMESFIEGLLHPPDDLDDNVIYAVPVMHTECWLIAASSERKFRRNIEYIRTKDAGRRFLARKFGCDISLAAQKAAEQLGDRLDDLRKHYASLDHFAARVESAFS